MKGTGTGELTVVDRFDAGVGWIAYPDEKMQRASHAVESDGGLWLIDPVDVAGLDELLKEYPDPAGVVILIDRHTRDSSALAARYDVPVYIPEWMDGIGDEIDAPIKRFGENLAGFDAIRLVDNPLWQEAVLFDGETLVVPEALGTVDYFCAPDETLGVHPLLRAFPPKRLRQYAPDRLVVGHGEGISENVGPAVRRAIDDARKTAISMYLENARELLGIR